MIPLTVIIPSYNRASLLDKTLLSLTHQSSVDFQVLVVDHASTDNTEEIALKYQSSLPLSYHKIARSGYSPGEPRDFGIREAKTPFIAFIDSGTIVPSCYVEAHLEFHHSHANYVGIGLQYRKDSDDGKSFDEELASFLSQTDIDKAYSWLQKMQMQDERAEIKLEESGIPWYFGWTANLSISREACLAVGGFDLDLRGWGFEDVDLCHRLARSGFKFAFVEHGWSIEIPQPRQAVRERLESNQKNMLLCYLKQRSLGLEALLLSEKLVRKAAQKFIALGTIPPDQLATLGQQMASHFRFVDYAEDIYRFLAQVGLEKQTLPGLRDKLSLPSGDSCLLIGGSARDVETWGYVTTIDDTLVSTSSLWSCAGILLPLADNSLDSVIVAPLWKKLDWAISYPFNLPRVSLLEFLILEISRVARQAIFLTCEAADLTDPSITLLEDLCSRHHLTFELVGLEADQRLPSLTTQ